MQHWRPTTSSRPSRSWVEVAKPKAKTGPVVAHYFRCATPAESEKITRRLRKIVDADLPQAFFERIANALAECQGNYQRAVEAPTPSELVAALRAIHEHSEELIRQLGSQADELVEPLRGISSAIGRNRLDQLRHLLRHLSEESVVALSPYLNLSKGKRGGLADPHQIRLGICCWEGLESIGIKPTLTNDEGRPNSQFLWLLEWALKTVKIGGDARKIGTKVKATLGKGSKAPH
jgi:hypothetical protein